MTMKKYLSMAVLALAGAMMSGCGNEDDFANDSKQQPANVNNVVTLTTTVGLGGGVTNRAMGEGGTNRALAAGGVKTFAAGERMAIVYKNTAGQTVKAVSEALTDADITTTDDVATDKKSATFTFTLTDPDRTVDVRYIYPAAMAKDVATDAAIDDAGTINYAALATQDGTLTTLSSTLDLATYDGAWDEGKLPGGTLQNRLAILACTIKKHAGVDFTSSITGMTVSDGINNYTVNREEAVEAGTADGPIYVAIRPTTGATINVTATNATRTYTKTLTAKTYEASNGYPVSWKMDLPVLDIADCEETIYTVTEDMVITGSRDNFTIYTDGNHEITLDNVNHEDMVGRIDLDFSSSMTIKLKGVNRLDKIWCYPQVTINDAGDGTLIVIDSNNAIDLNPEGGGDTGTLVINGGTVKAKSTLAGNAVAGNLTVNGGAVYLAGGGVERAVSGEIGGEATWFGWNVVLWQLGSYISQYITTDDSSGDPTDPTDPGNSKWNW